MESSVFVTIEIYEDSTKTWKEVAKYPLRKICVLLGRNKNLKKESGDILIDESVCSPDIYNKISSIHLTFFRKSSTEKDKSYQYSSILGYAVKDGYNNKPTTNGTFLNGRKLEQKTNLNDQDILIIGQKIRVIYHQDRQKNMISDDLNDTYTGMTEELK